MSAIFSTDKVGVDLEELAVVEIAEYMPGRAELQLKLKRNGVVVIGGLSHAQAREQFRMLMAAWRAAV